MKTVLVATCIALSAAVYAVLVVTVLGSFRALPANAEAVLSHGQPTAVAERAASPSSALR